MSNATNQTFEINSNAEWCWRHAPTSSDDDAMAADLVAADGTVLASCLVSDGELDIDSDGCGVLVDGLRADDIDWPDDDDADAARAAEAR